jgi:hypothetical protein
MSPLSAERAGRLVDFLADVDGVIVEIGCGWAELLLRAVTVAPRATAIGIDLDEAAIAHGHRSAAERGLADRVVLTSHESALPSNAAAALSVAATHAWAPPATGGSEPLHYDRALARIRSLLAAGGRVGYGEGIWSRPPTAAAVAALGGREDEMVDLDHLVRIATDSGFDVASAEVATEQEWDEFESGYVERYRRWLAAHPDGHPDAAEVRGRLERQRDAYLNGYRGVLGFAYLELMAT